MSDTLSNDTTEVPEKPVQEAENVFPPFPEPTDDDFDEDIAEEERVYYKNKFQDLNRITTAKLHCSACDRHLGCSARSESKMRAHPMLRTLVCHTCHTFYNSGEFDKGDDGSELYCRWCGQGGQVYCCSDCPHVFCAKCIKRNLGVPKIREIEQLDDWKCFRCNPKCLWDIRAICWAVLRYCDLKNRITYKTQDPDLKEKYQEDCLKDHSVCCKSKQRRKIETKKEKKETDQVSKKSSANIISKIPPTIQVKKFASINADELKNEKRVSLAQKRPASPKNKSIFIKHPIPMTTPTKAFGLTLQPAPKRMKVPICPAPSPRFNNDKKTIPVFGTYVRTPRPKASAIPVLYNGFTTNNNAFNVNNDNINLSIESLTQGLDMSAVAAMVNSAAPDDDVVCTPDFPMEPLCEVTEENPDDDVQCITPAPVTTKVPPPLVSRTLSNLPDLSAENVIQMTDNDVTVNATTGGLKFRVDPQTLSSNKMYRLPDGRIFAINVNANMPGGYSATIVAVTDHSSTKVPQKGATYAAKLRAVSAIQTTTPPPLKTITRSYARNKKGKSHSTPIQGKTKSKPETRNPRTCDLNVPVEWFRYNLIDAIDALEYSLSRLNQLKKESSSTFLRSRSANEMRSVTQSLENLLNTSSTRFIEIKESLGRDLKQYISKKDSDNANESDDDDVEILPDIDNDDPIFIDENSIESNSNEGAEVDLTCVGSEQDSSEKSVDKIDFHGLSDNIHEIKDDETVLKHKNTTNDKGINESIGNDNVNEKKLSQTCTETKFDTTVSTETNENDDHIVVERLDDELMKEWDKHSTDDKVTNVLSDLVKKKKLKDDVISNSIKDVANDGKDMTCDTKDNVDDAKDCGKGDGYHSMENDINCRKGDSDLAKVGTVKIECVREDIDDSKDGDVNEERINDIINYTENENKKITENDNRKNIENENINDGDIKDTNLKHMDTDDKKNEDMNLGDELQIKQEHSKTYNETIEELLKDCGISSNHNACEKSSESKDS